MKCPFCAEEIKAEAVVCKHCSRDLVKKPKKEKLGKASLRKSLAEQAQGCKKEVRKIGPGAGVEKTKKCPFCAEEILAEAIFCKHCHQMLSETESRKDEKQAKRPKLVWAITIFYVISVPFTLLSVLSVSTGQVPLSPAMQAYFDSLSVFDYSLTTLVAALNVAGAISLFRLRTSAVWLLTVALGLNGFLSLSHALTTNWIEAMAEASGLGGIFLGWLIALGIVFYTWRLKQKGVLTDREWLSPVKNCPRCGREFQGYGIECGLTDCLPPPTPPQDK